MTRPRKQTVDYFPHSCNHKKTMFVIEQKYGNDGYAFWFKLLEMLGSAEGHYLNFENDMDWEFLIARTRLDKDKCSEMLDLLSILGAIDKELWEANKIVWSDNFVENIKDAYRNRTVEVPAKPSILRKKPVSNGINDNINPDNVSINPINDVRNPQTKLKEKNNIPYDEIAELYNIHCSKLVKLKNLTDKRKIMIKNRWLDNKCSLDFFVEFFALVNSSDFLTGEKTDFRAGFDWIMNKNNMVKILEGQYANKQKSKPEERSIYEPFSINDIKTN